MILFSNNLYDTILSIRFLVDQETTRELFAGPYIPTLAFPTHAYIIYILPLL
jgi:hypothetical protein